MAQERSLTPEKQLLKIIESSKMNSLGVHAQTSRRHSMSWLNFGAWLGRISFLKGRFEKWSKGFSLEQLDVKVVNRVLGFLVVPLLLYFSGNLIIALVNLGKAPRLESNTTAVKIETSFPEPAGLKKAVSYYLDKVRERDIFTMGLKKSAVDLTPSSRSLDVSANLKLVGISWSADPDAMIEDTKELKTFFVKRGEMVGGAKVQAIFKDKVVLSLGKEEFELK
ncbi:MAG: hypothetical protein Q8N62_00685 [Candidatus Omnitrophota bacterium]|nr:hypothetical protein [Candidatus Omnitrophota bacterium]